MVADRKINFAALLSDERSPGPEPLDNRTKRVYEIMDDARLLSNKAQATAVAGKTQGFGYGFDEVQPDVVW
jgi:hypothetical protein